MNIAQHNAGKNDFAVHVNWYVRWRNSLKAICGWIKGERFHTPSPFNKLFLNLKRKKSLSMLAKMPHVSVGDIDNNAIIYCMHVQPESTLDTYSPDLWNQSLVIQQLAEACIVAKRPFYVRIHPRAKHEVSMHFIELKNSSIKIISSSVSMKDILHYRPTIVTISGTVLLEAATAGIPAVALDQSYLSTYPGVLYVPLNNFSKFLSGELKSVLPTDQSQAMWFESINRYSHKGLISAPEWSSKVLDRENLADVAFALRLAVCWAANEKYSELVKIRSLRF